MAISIHYVGIDLGDTRARITRNFPDMFEGVTIINRDGEVIHEHVTLYGIRYIGSISSMDGLHVWEGKFGVGNRARFAISDGNMPYILSGHIALCAQKWS